MAAFPEKVREARSELGLTQTELGAQVGVSLRSVLDYEKGKKFPRRSTLLKLAKALQVSVRYLTDDTCENPLADIEKDGYIAEARKRYGAMGARDMDSLLDDNLAFLAGGDVPQEQKDVFFDALMSAYVKSKEAAREKFGRKNS